MKTSPIVEEAKNQEKPKRKYTKRNLEFSLVPPARYAMDSKELSLLTASSLSEIVERIRSLTVEQKLLLHKLKLVMSLPSVVYGIPAHFLVFNAKVTDLGKISVSWTWEDLERRKIKSLAMDPEATSYLFVGIRLDEPILMPASCIQIGFKAWAPEGTITFCDFETMEYEDFLNKFWRPGLEIGDFLNRIEITLQTLRHAQFFHDK